MTNNVFLVDEEGNQILIRYQIEYEIHPDYKDMSVKELKKIFNFDDHECVPDIALITILSEFGNGISQDDIKYAIMDDLNLAENEIEIL